MCCIYSSTYISGLPRQLGGKESTCLQRRPRFNPWVAKIPRRRKWQPPLVFLSGKFYGQKSLASYSPWGCKESDTTEHTHMQHIINKYLSAYKKLYSPHTHVFIFIHIVSVSFSLFAFSLLPSEPPGSPSLLLRVLNIERQK